jgi:hypothetical protein
MKQRWYVAFYLPQIADGARYQTQIILHNTSRSAGTIHIDSFDEQGNKVALR